MRAIAPNADLRPFHSSARSASSAATRTVRAPCASADALDDRDLRVDAVGQAVDLDEQHRRGVARVAGADVVLDRAGDLGVHHLERGGHDPRGDDPAHRGAGVLDRGEVEQQRADRGRVRREPHRDPRSAMPIVPSLPTKQPRRS